MTPRHPALRRAVPARPARAVAALAAAGAGAALLTGCGGSAHAAAPARISVTGAYIPLPAGGDLAAGYFTLHNTGGSAAVLTGVTSPQASQVSMHQSTETSMTDLAQVKVPAHGTVSFSRGGRHVMITGLAPAPKLGQQVELRLAFRDSAAITVRATIEPITYRPSGG